MSLDGTPTHAAAGPTDEDPKASFSRWYNAQVAQRGWRPKDVRRKLQAVGAGSRWKPPTLTGWSDGTARPSESACVYIARAFGVPIPEALAAAKYNDIAEIWAAETVPNHAHGELRRNFPELTDEEWEPIEEKLRTMTGDAFQYAALAAEKTRREKAQPVAPRQVDQDAQDQDVDRLNGTHLT